MAGMPVSGSPYIARRENRNEVGVTPRPPTEPNLLSPPVLTENQVLCTQTFAHLRHSCIIAIQDRKGALKGVATACVCSP